MKKMRQVAAGTCALSDPIGDRQGRLAEHDDNHPAQVIRSPILTRSSDRITIFSKKNSSCFLILPIQKVSHVYKHLLLTMHVYKHLLF